MKYGIVGSRSRKDRRSVVDFVNSLQPGDVVISGGCRGVDTWAAEAARARGLKVVEFLPDLAGCRERWQYTRAYFARNEQIAQECDTLVAFVAEVRKGGTENTIKHARKLGHEVIICPPPSSVPRSTKTQPLLFPPASV